MQGELECADRGAAIRQVEQKKYIPIKIEPVTASKTTGKTSGASPPATSPSRSTPPGKSSSAPAPVVSMSHSQIHLFTEQLAHLLTAGVTLDESLGILVKRLKHPKLNAVAKALHQGLVDGRSLSQALKDFPRIFSPLYVNMVAAGEASGSLNEILRRLTVHLADLKSLRDRVQQALLYPAILVLVGFGMIIIFMTVVVPKLTAFFANTGQTLPLPTQILIKSNEILSSYWWVGVAGGAAIFSLWKVYVRTPHGRLSWDRFLWNIPVFGDVPRYRYYAQFARTLGTLMQNGVTLLRALELLEEIAGNEFIRQKMTRVRDAVVDGVNVSVASAKEAIFPELFCDMIAVGEQTGKFAETMLMVADVYERELDKRVQIMSALIPPVIMIVIASIVGAVVFAILSAVLSMTSGLRGGGA